MIKDQKTDEVEVEVEEINKYLNILNFFVSLHYDFSKCNRIHNRKR